MKGFLYYLPGPDRLSRARVEASGLGYVLDGPSGPGPAFAGMSPGPDGKAGVVFSVAGIRSDGTPSPSVAGRAKWIRVPDSEAWLGLVDELAPGPSDLVRCEQIDGHEVLLGDGARWLVPVVRTLKGETCLPRALELSGREWVQGDVRPIYRKLWSAALRMWDAIVGAPDGEPVTFIEEMTTAVAALSLNYRLGPAEVSALGLLDTRSQVEVLKALIDLPALGAVRGKVAAATLS